MSEVKDTFIYNLYDYMKAIYIYSHLKTNLKDSLRQGWEYWTNVVVFIFSGIFILMIFFKIMVIFIYFIFFQAFFGFFIFLRSLCKTKFQIYFFSSFTNACSYLGKVCKRMYSFNFYMFENKIFGFLMLFSYFFFLTSIEVFSIFNLRLIEDIEKPIYYLIWFYLHFESLILIQLLCSSFYAYRDLKITLIFSVVMFVVMNSVLILGYFIKDKWESVHGSFEYELMQAIMNIFFNVILLLVNLISFYKVITYNKNGKCFN